MRVLSFIRKFLCIIVCFTLIQIPQVYATSSDVSYVAGRFAWDLAEMLKYRQPEISVPPEVYKNDLLDECLKAATDVYPQGEILIKAIKYSGITKTLTVDYIDKNAYVFIANTKDDLIEIRSIANRLHLSKFVIGFPALFSINSYQEIENIDPLIEYNADESIISSYDKSGSTISGYNWRFPLVLSFDLVKGESESDNILIKDWIYNNIANINPNSTVRDKVEAVNRILVYNFEYDIYSDPDTVPPHLPSNLIKTGKGVCSAYALLAYQMLTDLGVDAKIITGTDLTGQESHAWLIVKTEDNNWYHFDPTWNDPVPDVKGRVDTTFNLVSDTQMAQTHVWDSNEYNYNVYNTEIAALKKINNPTVVLTIDNPLIKINNISTSVDSNPAVVPTLINDSTYLPLRTLTEIFGGTIAWNDITKTATITMGNKKIDITINSPVASLNGRTVQLIAPALISEGRTLLPLRSVMEILGKTVSWDNDTRSVTIQ